MMNLDEQILNYYGGLNNKSLINILNLDHENDFDDNMIQHSHYYDSKKFIDILKNKNKCFSILSTNIESLNSKHTELDIFVEELYDQNCEISAFCLQECWIKDEIDSQHLSISGYNMIVQGRSASTKGGLVIYLKDCYNFKILPQSLNSEYCEILFIEVSGGNLNQNYIIGKVYRPPRDLIDNYRIFIDELHNTIANLLLQKKNIFIAGDFNINLLSVNDREIFGDFFDTFLSNSLYPKITLPTRFSSANATLIDNIFTNIKSSTRDNTSGILLKKFSDHQPCFTLIDQTNTYCSDGNLKFVKVVKYTPENIRRMQDEIDKSNLIQIINPSLTTDPNISYNALAHVIANAKNIHIPFKLVKYNKYKHKKSKWITPGILKSIKYRDKLYKSWRQAYNTSESSEIIKRNLSTYNNILKKTIRNAKKMYFDKCLSKCKNDIKNTWRTINHILGRNNTVKSLPSEFKIDDNVIEDKHEIANHFNKYFLNIGHNLAGEINYSGNKSFETYLNRTGDSVFSFSPVTTCEVKKAINNLKSKNSTGEDGISTTIIKKCENSLTPALTLIINQCLTTGIFPDKLKIAKVVPIFKKEDDSLLCNYRPISLLPAISKVFERIIFNQLYEYFSSNNLFYKSQYGFRKKHSTEMAALELIDKIKLDLDKGELPLAIFLDLSKAFDTIDHSIHIHKLSFYGVKYKALDLFKSYLQNRKQYVEVDGTASDCQIIKTGVPQGSILGPLLFLIYINDISNASKQFDMISYADDSTIYKSFKMSNISRSITKFNDELNNITEWLKLNKLSLNIKKSKYILFHDKRRNIPDINIIIDGVNLCQTDEFCFLGLNINQNLKWNTHVNKIG